MKNTVVFDLDGTLTDSAPGIFNAIKYLQNKMNLTPLSEEQLRSCVGPPLNESFMRLWGVNFETAEEFVKIYREYYLPTGIFENTVYDGINELLKSLKANDIRLLICSAKPTSMINTVLEHFDILKYFDQISGVALTGKLPTKGERLKAMLEDKNAYMVGDRKDDIIGAREAGIKSIGVLWGYGSIKELTDSGADYIVSSASELKDLLRF